ncbi:MAG: T9SS type A sorting domain-containing protein [Bacteroidia bacterium]|nr:T9SS type A sorting domain-containing protein [Bacteroidia bacterium]
MVSLPLQPVAQMRAKDLLNMTGATLLTFWDPVTSTWKSHTPSTPDNSPTNIVLKEGESYIINMLSAKTVTFTGTQWQGNIPLTGTQVSMVGLPIQPTYPKPYRAKHLIQAAGAGYLIFYDIYSKIFKSCMPTFPDNAPLNIELEQGNGYILINAPNKILHFDGSGYKNMTIEQTLSPNETYENTPALSLINMPNPFRERTVIEFTIPEPALVVLNIYDISGKLVKNLINSNMENGTHQIIWDGTNETGIKVSMGCYFCHLISDNENMTRQILIIQ